MAGNIKGITIEIGGDTQKLNKALEDVNKKSKDIQSELKQVEKLLKLDPKNTELLAQKQKLLADAVSNSKEKLDRLKAAQQQVNEQFAKGEISEEQYRAFQREVAKAEQELQGFEKQLKDTAAASKSLGEKMKEAGTKMKDVGSTLTKNVTVPLVAAGAGAVAMGKSFDDAYDKIRIGTGATGKALEGLNEDFRRVAKQVPSSFDDISTAIADYNTRLGISGQALQDLSVQTLNLARITEGDLGKIIEETSQAFQAFQVPTENYGDALDYVFKVAQSTGISIDRLEQNLVKFSPALKQMGFDFYDSAALMGFFDKAGVEVEQAMTGLNKALVNMAKAGVTDANEALQMLFNEIKDAPSDIKATELAIEVFGSKAGPLMASAIREGKLEYEALVQELMNSKETINGVAAETDDWAEGLAKLKNQVMIATEPIATTLFDALNGLVPLLERAVPALQKLADGFANLPQGAQVAIIALAGLAALLGPLLQGIGAIVIAAPGLVAIFAKIAAAGAALGGVLSTIAGAVLPVLGAAIGAITAPVAIAIAAIAGLIAVGVLVYKNWEEIKEFGSKLWADLSTGWVSGIDGIKTAWTDFGQNIKDTWENMWNGIITFYDTTKTNMQNATIRLTDFMLDRWNKFKAGLIEIWSAITGAIKGFVNNQLQFVNKLIDALNSIKVEIPEWVPGFGGNSFGINLPHVPYLAQGGIVTRPTLAMIGEAGPEAVVPLKKGWGTTINEINIYGNNADEIWSKFERELHRKGVVF